MSLSSAVVGSIEENLAKVVAIYYILWHHELEAKVS